MQFRFRMHNVIRRLCSWLQVWLAYIVHVVTDEWQRWPEVPGVWLHLTGTLHCNMGGSLIFRFVSCFTYTRMLLICYCYKTIIAITVHAFVTDIHTYWRLELEQSTSKIKKRNWTQDTAESYLGVDISLKVDTNPIGLSSHCAWDTCTYVQSHTHTHGTKNLTQLCQVRLQLSVSR